MLSVSRKMKLHLILLLFLNSSLSDNIRYDNYKLFKVIPLTPQAAEELSELEQESPSGYDFWTAVGPPGEPVEIMVSPLKVGELQNMVECMNMQSEIMAENVQERIDAEMGARIPDEFGWRHYNTLAEINEWLRSLTIKYPSIVSLIQLNKTYEGRTMLGVKVLYGSSEGKKSVFVESNIHAREWISSATSTYILNQLLTSTNSSVRELAEKHIWYFFPVFNPDGFEFSHTSNRMWRKTRVQHVAFCTGADPNRNWDYKWYLHGPSFNPCANTYTGPYPFSEPCTKVMSEFIKTVGRDLVAYIGFHSFSQILLIPYGHTSKHLDNYNLMYQIGVKAVEVLRRRYGTQYRIGSVYDRMGKITGSSADWVKGVFKTPIVYTYELRDRGKYGFQLPRELIIPTAEEAFDAFIVLFEEYYKAVDK